MSILGKSKTSVAEDEYKQVKALGHEISLALGENRKKLEALEARFEGLGVKDIPGWALERQNLRTVIEAQERFERTMYQRVLDARRRFEVIERAERKASRSMGAID